MLLWRKRMGWLIAASLGVGCAPAARPEAAGGARLSDSAFGAVVTRYSEPDRYFDTDNLISNEGAYLDVVTGLERRGVRGGAYLGVGPDQNFSYIARIRPNIAFIIDIRRDNLLQHLWYKALFAAAPTRSAFLARVYGKRLADSAEWRDAPVSDLVGAIADLPTDSGTAEAIVAETVEATAALGVPLSVEDLATVAGIHRRFIAAGPDLRFTTFGRAPRPCYPTHRDLLVAVDRRGAPASYLATEEDYRFVRRLEERNLIIPVVGDLAGPTALPGIAEYLRRRGEGVSAFYVSNVEFYLVQDGTFPQYVENVARLPGDDPILIRSVFQGPAARRRTASGSTCSAQLLQPAATLVGARSGVAFQSYTDLVTRDTLPLGP